MNHHSIERKELAEQFEELAAFDRSEARLATGDDECVPSHVVDALLNGIPPLRFGASIAGCHKPL